MLRFEVLEGDRKGRTFEVQDDVVRLGRAEANQVSLPEFHVSGEHAIVTFDGEHWTIRDLQSTNGTRVARGEQTIDVSTADGREVQLQSGDHLLLGDAEHPVRLTVTLDDGDDEPRIVSVRRVDEIPNVESDLGADSTVLRALYGAQKEIAATLEVEALLDVVAKAVFAFLSRATHVTVALRADGETSKRSGRYVPIGSRVRGADAIDAVPISRSVFRRVVAERAAVLAADARKDLGETASIMGAQILSTIGVPLWHGEAIIGVLQVDNRTGTGVFRERDLDLLAVLAQSASQAFSHAMLYQRLRVAEEQQRKENVYLKQREQSRREGAIIGEAPSMKRLFEQLRKVVNTRVTVLVEGETGTGKELIASAVHYWSERREKLFVAQNCAAMPENLLESELFGHKKGAFTGATEEKKGLFELADGGTLFLDEVGEMPLALQAKLLRALQEGEIRPLGSNKTIRVDTRIVAATHRDLEKEVEAGRFREDLYYRLKVFPLRVPALRERNEDVPLLAAHFLRSYSQQFGRQIRGFSQEAMELLRSYKWPGNVRELQNEVQRLVIQVDDDQFVMPDDLSPKVRQVEGVFDRVLPTTGTLKERMDQYEKRILVEQIREAGGNKSAAARVLGITREGLHKKLRSLGLT